MVSLDFSNRTNLQAGDTLTMSAFGQTISFTVTNAMISSTGVLAQAVKTEIDTLITGGSITGISGVTVTDDKVQITGTNDVTGSSMIENQNIEAADITRDTTANSQFVDDDGVAITPTTTGDPIIAQFNIATAGGATQSITLDLGAINTLDGITQFAGEYTPTQIERDGAQFGSLDRVEVNEEGVMTAVFSNGQVRPIYRIPLINFTNVNGLIPVDGNAFQQSIEAGAYYMWDAGVGPTGTISSASLESSTVDIAEEFSNMIIAQRAYSSNARIIQTADEMLQEITNLKR